MKRTYLIENDGIFCRKCGKHSYNVYDAANLYCGHCRTFHNESDILYEDLFGNGFIYDKRNLNEDCLTLHNNLESGVWTVLRITMGDNEAEMTKMLAFGMIDTSIIIHKIGVVNGFAFISQNKMTDSQIENFKNRFGRTLVFGKF